MEREGGAVHMSTLKALLFCSAFNLLHLQNLSSTIVSMITNNRPIMPHVRPSPRPSQKAQEDGTMPPPRSQANKNNKTQQNGTMAPQPQPKGNDKKQEDRTVPIPTVDSAGQQLPCKYVMDARFAHNLGVEARKRTAQEPKQASGKGVDGAKAQKVMLKLTGVGGGKQGKGDQVEEQQKNDDTEDRSGEAENTKERDPASALLLLSRVIETDEEVLEAARILVGMWGHLR
jgi:hypothetical protein